MRRAEGAFYVVTGSGFGVRDGGWIRKHMPRDGSVELRDVSSAYGVINICGPRARDVLAAATEDDLTNAAFPYMTCRWIRIGYAPGHGGAHHLCGRVRLGIARPDRIHGLRL